MDHMHLCHNRTMVNYIWVHHSRIKRKDRKVEHIQVCYQHQKKTKYHSRIIGKYQTRFHQVSHLFWAKKKVPGLIILDLTDLPRAVQKAGSQAVLASHHGAEPMTAGPRGGATCCCSRCWFLSKRLKQMVSNGYLKLTSIKIPKNSVRWMTIVGSCNTWFFEAYTIISVIFREQCPT